MEGLLAVSALQASLGQLQEGTVCFSLYKPFGFCRVKKYGGPCESVRRKQGEKGEECELLQLWSLDALLRSAK